MLLSVALNFQYQYAYDEYLKTGKLDKVETAKVIDVIPRGDYNIKPFLCVTFLSGDNVDETFDIYSYWELIEE